MPGPEQLIRAAVMLPIEVTRRVVGPVLGLVGGLLPGDDEPPEPDTTDMEVEVAIAADDAMTRDRDPVEEAPLVPEDDDLSGHVEQDVELVAESTDPEASGAPGPEIHVEP